MAPGAFDFEKKMSEVVEIEVKVKLRPAELIDFAYGKKPDDLHFGRIFYLKKPNWDHYEGPYSLNKENHVATGYFREWFTAGMVWVKAGGD